MAATLKIRDAQVKVLQFAKQYPVVTITGPRQSGKTTLCKMLFKHKPYVSLESPDERQFALSDPRGFLEKYPQGAILDEIQRAPELLSYIQGIVDDKPKAGFFILTGSHQFELMNTISQSLAGRTALVTLLPFTLKEAYGKTLPKLEAVLYAGFYPRIFDKKLSPTEAMSFYFSTYIERDLRSLINVKELSTFENFMKLCVARTGQIVNYSNLASDCGVSHNTVKHWLSILEASYVIKLLQPYYKNINKRVIKAPKLYFLDTGLACFLMGIHDAKQLEAHPLRGALFETLVMTEILKSRCNQALVNGLYFYRDHAGNEIDLVLDRGSALDLIEIKMGKTIHSDFFKGIHYYQKNSAQKTKAHLVYGGEAQHVQEQVQILGWKKVGAVF